MTETHPTERIAPITPDPLFNPRFNYCIGDIKAAKVQGFVSLSTWVNRIRNPRDFVVNLVSKIRAESNEGKRAQLKAKLPSVTPAVLFEKGASRRYSNIKAFTGLMMLDFDKINYADEFRDFLFYEYPFILASWLSSSGKGARAIVRIPFCKSTDEFKLRYDAIAEIMHQFEGFDTAPKNSVLPLFYSIDAEIKFDLHRNTVFSEITVPKPEPERKPINWRLPEGRESKWAIQNTIKAIDKITGNGHPQLRGASFALGGYIAANYLSEREAVDLMDKLIESNSYLKQKADVYKKTARTMIKKGQSKPLNL